MCATLPLRDAERLSFRRARSLGSFVCALRDLLRQHESPPLPRSPGLISGRLFYVPLGLTLDPLSQIDAVHRHRRRRAHPYLFVRLHARRRGQVALLRVLSLFMFSMLGIVLANNFVMMFIFWELVGVSSYLLIGYWFERDAAADAAKKAFITNRLGDFGFMLGILMVWTRDRLVRLREIAAQSMNGSAEHPGYLTAAALLVFCGAVGQVRAIPAARLVAGRDGRPDAGLRA